MGTKRGQGTRKENQGSNWIHRPTRLAIYRRDGQCCMYCGRHLYGKQRQLDHVTPVECGGLNGLTRTHAGNLVTACVWCNAAKGGRTLAAWFSDRANAAETKKEASELRRIERAVVARVNAALELPIDRKAKDAPKPAKRAKVGTRVVRFVAAVPVEPEEYPDNDPDLRF